MATTYHLRPVSTITRSSSPTASSSTVSDRSPPPLNAHHPPSNSILPPSTTASAASFSPIPISARPRRPLSPSSLRDVDIPLDPSRALAARGKFPIPPTGHELMALFPPAPPVLPPGPTSGFFEREERKFFAQAGKEIVRLRLEIDTLARPSAVVGGAVGGSASASMPPPPVPQAVSPRRESHQHQHTPTSHNHGPPLTTSPRTHVPPPPPPAAPASLPLTTTGPAHPGYPVRAPASGGGAEAMVVEEDEEDAWRRPTPHNARRRAGKHTRRVIVK